MLKFVLYLVLLKICVVLKFLRHLVFSLKPFVADCSLLKMLAANNDSNFAHTPHAHKTLDAACALENK